MQPSESLVHWADGQDTLRRMALPPLAEGMGLVVQDLSGRIVSANAAACALLGLSWEQMQGLVSVDPRWAALDEDGLPLDGADHPAMVTLATGQPVADVIMGVAAPGEGNVEATTWITVTTVPLRDEGGELVGVAATMVDASSSGRGLAAMNRVVAAYRSVAENASDVVVRTTPAAVIEWVSPSVTIVLGWTPANLVGTRLSDLVHPDDRDGYLQESRRLNAGEVTSYRSRLRCADGGYRWMALHGRPILDTSGTVVARVGGFRDVQAEVEAETARVELEQRYRLIVENATDMVVLVAPDRRIDWVAPTVSATLGWEPEDLLGMPIADLIHPQERGRSEEVRAGLYRSGASPVRQQLGRLLAKDGSYRWMEARATPQLSESGEVVAVIASLRDVDDLVRERSRLQATFDSMLDPHVMLGAVRDESGRIVDFEYTDANRAACQYNGLSREDLVGSRLLDLLPGHAAAGLLEMYAHVIETGEPLALDDYVYANEIHRQDRYFDVRAVRVDDGLSYTWRDVTARHRAEQAIAESERRFRLLADNAMDLIFTVSPDGIVQWCSPSVAGVLGFGPEDLVGSLSMVVIHPEDRELAQRMAAEADRGGSPTYRARFVTKAGESKWMEVTPRALRDEAGEVRGRVVSVRDVDREVIAAEALEHEIEFDSLTGLAKRALVIDRIREIIVTRSEPQWALLCLGVQGMTSVNQAYSHAAGDEVLREVAARLVEATGAHDRVGRIAGDEFAILMRDIVTPADAADAAVRVLAAVEGPVEVGGGAAIVEIQACVGIALWSGMDAEALLRDATAAMRLAYAKGPGTWAILDSNIAAQSRHILDVAADLRVALAENQLQPWFMPLVDLASGEVHGYESLVRWVQPDGTVVPPDDFLPVAERSNLILQIDQVMLGRTLDALVHVGPGVHVAVNISAATLRAGQLEEIVRTELQRTGVDPHRLHLEVTETDLFDFTDEIDSVMRHLAELGITWWIDDFGTGFSSISHLRDMPIQGVKLDRSFTAGLTDGDDRAVRLAQGLAGLAEGLGLMTIAEGVETAEQASVLLAQGWQMGQGWLFGQATPVDT